jgi:LemA protein
MDPIWIVLIVLVVVAAFVVFIYNGLIQRRNVVDEAWNQISVQLKRRHDLIPNLVNAVKGYMDFEQETLTRVVEARGAAVTASQAGPAGAAQQAQAENFLTGALRQLFALVENYPDLKANQNVLQLQEELTTTENQIGFSRQHYNSVVRDFNTSIQTFPSVLIAGTFGFRARDYFQIEEADAVVPTVNLRNEPPQAAPPAGPPQT